MKETESGYFLHPNWSSTAGSLKPVSRILFSYVLLSAIWFFLVDRLLLLLTHDASVLGVWAVLKPWTFVGATSVVLFFTLRRSLDRLRSSEQRWKTLFDAAPDAYYLHDMTGTFLDGNTAAQELSGYRKEEFIGKNVFKFDLLVPDDLATAAELLERNRQGKPAGPTAYTLKRKDGTLVAIEVRTLPVRLQEQDLVLGIARDITERKRAEIALRESEQFAYLTLDALSAHICVLDESGTIVAVNRSWGEFAQANGLLPQQAAPGCNYLAVCDAATGLDSESASSVAKAIRLILKGETDEFSLEYACHSPTQKRWFQCRVTRFGKSEGVRVVVAHQNITERKLAEERLRESEARFSAVFYASPIAIGISDFESGRFVDVNETLVRTFGFERHEVLGHTSVELGLWVSAGERDHLVATLREQGRVQQLEAKFRRKSGEIGDLLISAELMKVEGKEYLVGMLLDITTRKRLEAQLLQAQKMEAVGQLAGGVAHDFNNILAAQLLQLQLVQRHPNLDSQVMASLQEFQKGIERAASLTRQLLLFSRRQVMQTQRVNVDEIISGLMTMLRRLLGEHIVIGFTRNLEAVWVDADPGMLEQVVVNLCVNARDAMPNGGSLSIRTETVVLDASDLGSGSERRSGSFACISVQDTGCGMDDATLKRIFEPFFTTKEAGKGTGLGLATVHGITKQHEGWIEVQSAVNRGTSFRVFLPAKEASLHVPSAVDESSIPGGTESILVVEDDTALRLMVKRTLVLFGYRVLEAESAAEAESMWGAHREVDLVFTDMVMPGGQTGLELTERLRRVQPGLKVLISSGYSSDLPREIGNLPAGVRFLAKPYTPSALAAAVRQALDDARAPKSGSQ